MGTRKERITSSGSAAIGWGLLWAGVGSKLLGDRDAVAGARGEGLDGGEKRKGDRGEERRAGRERMEEEFGVSVWLRVGLYNKRAALQVAPPRGSPCLDILSLF